MMQFIIPPDFYNNSSLRSSISGNISVILIGLIVIDFNSNRNILIQVEFMFSIIPFV